MPREHLATYLNDHLSGATAAVELLDHLASTYKQPDINGFVIQLKREIEDDTLVLEDLMARLKVEQSRSRKASAWLAGKLGELKLVVDDPAAGSLRLFESLEALSLGIEGKRSLWLALIAAAEKDPNLNLINYERMVQRAEDQRNRVEARRRELAKNALTSQSSSSAQSSGSGVH